MPLVLQSKTLWFYSAPGPQKGIPMPLVLQPQLRQAPLWGSSSRHWFYRVKLLVLLCARPPSGGQTSVAGSTE
jgi:hypothetical protein